MYIIIIENYNYLYCLLYVSTIPTLPECLYPPIPDGNVWCATTLTGQALSCARLAMVSKKHHAHVVGITLDCLVREYGVFNVLAMPT